MSSLGPVRTRDGNRRSQEVSGTFQPPNTRPYLLLSPARGTGAWRGAAQPTVGAAGGWGVCRRRAQQSPSPPIASTHTRTSPQAQTHTWKHVRMHKHMHRCANTPTNACTNIHTNTHTYKHKDKPHANKHKCTRLPHTARLALGPRPPPTEAPPRKGLRSARTCP